MKVLTYAKQMIQKAWAPTLVVTLIFFLTYRFFGMENTMIGPFATLSFLRFRSMCNHYECMVKNFVIYAVMAVLAFLAMQGFGLCILINAAALFWIAYILIDEYNPTNYFPAGMALIFFQIAPAADVHALGIRLLALLATFVLIFLFVWILSLIARKENPLPSYMKEGFSICKKLIDPNVQNNSEEEALHHQLCNINRKASEEIYSYNRASIRLKGKTNWYCQFILAFQILNYLTLHRTEGDNLSEAKDFYEKSLNTFENQTPGSDYKRLNFRVNRPDIRNFRLRFALRQVIILTPCLVFCWWSDLPNVYWLVISVFFMMIPYSEQTGVRVRQRVLGTIAGIVICMILFTVFPAFGERTIIMTIANFLIYSVSGYGATVAYITCSALAIQTINSVVGITLGYRLAYTLIGAGIALAANKWLFPIRMKKQIAYLKELLLRIRKKLIQIDAGTTPGDPLRRRKIDERIIKSYLLSKRLEFLYHSLPESEADLSDYEDFEKEHMSFLASYLGSYMINR